MSFLAERFQKKILGDLFGLCIIRIHLVLHVQHLHDAAGEII